MPPNSEAEKQFLFCAIEGLTAKLFGERIGHFAFRSSHADRRQDAAATDRMGDIVIPHHFAIRRINQLSRTLDRIR